MRRIIMALVCGVLTGCSGQRYDSYDLGNFPVIPEINASMQARLRRVHVFGSRKGVRPKVFSFVGDNITVSPAFMDELATDRVDYGQYSWLAEQVAAYRAVEVRTVDGIAYSPLTVESFSVLSR